MINKILLFILPWILPSVYRFAYSRAFNCTMQGRHLTENEIEIAKRVGVKKPFLISVLLVDEVSGPDGFILRTLGKLAGFPFSQLAGITFGYGITVRRDVFGNKLLAHECRHVAQYEELGFELFLTAYLTQVLSVGYWDAFFEQDARAFQEIS